MAGCDDKILFTRCTGSLVAAISWQVVGDMENIRASIAAMLAAGSIMVTVVVDWGKGIINIVCSDVPLENRPDGGLILHVSRA